MKQQIQNLAKERGKMKLMPKFQDDLPGISGPCIDLAEIAIDPVSNQSKPFVILQAGTWWDDHYGEIQITNSMLEDFVSTWTQNVRGIQLAINYDHERRVAAGWIQTLQVQDGNLWCTAEWTPTGRTGILAKEYRYFSVEFRTEYKDHKGRKWANVLTGGALTNYPVMKTLGEVAAAETTETREKMPRTKTELAIELATDHKVDLNMLETAAVELAEAKKAQAVIMAELETVKNQFAETKKALDEKIAALDLAEKAALKTRVDALIKRGMDEGRITKAFAESELPKVIAGCGIEFAENMLKNMPKVIPGEPTGSDTGADKVDETAGKDAALVFSETANRIAKEKNVSFSEAVKLVRLSHPEIAKAYDETLKA